MSATLVNAAPMVRRLGTQDISPRTIPIEPEAIPTHLPKAYIYAQTGPTTPELVVGASMTQMYGVDSFDLRKKYANHATVLATTINAAGNSIMMQRIKPADANPPANMRLCLDLLAAQISQYVRGTDGQFLLDNDGQKQPVPGNTTVPGFRAKWVLVPIAEVGGENGFGLGTQAVGDQTDGATQSTRFPIMDLEVPHFGDLGNNQGVRIWAPTLKSDTPLDNRLLGAKQVYPFRMACVTRDTSTNTSRIVTTQRAEPFVNVCLKPEVIDPNTDAQVYVGDVFIDAYQNLNSPDTPPAWGPFGRLHVYDENVATLLNQLYTAEIGLVDAFTDFRTVADEEYLFNMISGVTSNNTPYYSYELVQGANNSVRLTETSNLYATGGSDGTMSDALFAGLVAEEVAAYADLNSSLQDVARFPESIVYDSGYPLATKYALVNFIAQRKDTMVILSTHDVNGPPLTSSQESSLAIALRTRIRLYPESEFFGTPASRGVIIGRSGKMLNTQYKKRLPLTIEIAQKAARYMGASDGKWKSVYNFDRAPNNWVTMFTDINIDFSPASVKVKDWAVGLNWVDHFDRRTMYWPAIRTIYDDDTSVLTSFFTVMCGIELQKVGERAHRTFSGSSSLTNQQLTERVNQFVKDNTVGRFDNRFIITPKAHFTAADEQRGYSWTLPILLQAPNMKTVETLYIVADRLPSSSTATTL
jgi:hypothetical protein